ncbi:uncharacterized protein LOC131309898 [Rhododendron vialii]|uniref:uncharacterized protein LOC131309898 n=1 Tax=Rhododendron vialii TaxID=182163 RepID=UPI00265DF51E|nr:uncharacterized protein LOC131309898 [Rhododendron vialii]
MESKSHKTVFVTLVVFAMVLSPMVTSCEAARSTHRELLQRPPICPACVCCAPPPPGSCCRCCATPTPVAIVSENGTP